MPINSNNLLKKGGCLFLNMNIFYTNGVRERLDFEVVERKGKGHPDTLADALAEELSVAYSLYTKSNFGAILHHNFDKVGLLGGQSFVKFGNGYLTKPIRVILNGRASTKFGSKTIPVKQILEETAKKFLVRNLYKIGKDDVKIFYFLSDSSSPGHSAEKDSYKGTRNFWFEPRGYKDLSELAFLHSNDTSLGCGYAPLSILEKVVLSVEEHINSDSCKKNNSAIGTDIKIMGKRVGKEISLTICIPQIADLVENQEEYKFNLKKVQKRIEKLISSQAKGCDFGLAINTRDNFDINELYLTATGSSIESGDEGLVGRGNRVNGLITPKRPMSMEGAAGKNPVYHIGKLYYVASFQLAQKIYDTFGRYNEVYLISQSGRSLTDPWKIIVAMNWRGINKSKISKLIEDEVGKIPSFTEKILQREIRLY